MGVRAGAASRLDLRAVLSIEPALCSCSSKATVLGAGDHLRLGRRRSDWQALRRLYPDESRRYRGWAIGFILNPFTHVAALGASYCLSARNLLMIALPLLLAACGDGAGWGSEPTASAPADEFLPPMPVPTNGEGWQGGLYRIWESDQSPRGVIILHQGHTCFDGCGKDASLIPVAERFATQGF